MRSIVHVAALLLVSPLAARVTQATPPQDADEAKVKKLIATAEEVEKEVEALRGWEFKRPVKKGVHSEEQLRKFIEKKLLEEDFGGGKLERIQWMLADLGFIPKDMDLAKTIVDVLLSQVGGFYDPERGSFFMMTKTADYGESVNRMMIAHELTHALDDQYYGLNPLMKARQDDHDAGFAIGAVVEGSATALMQRWAQEYGMKKYDMMKELKKVAKREAEQAKVLLSAPPYFATMIARYLVGVHFLTKGKGQLGLARMKNGVAETAGTAFQHVPLSSEQILHPEKYWDPDKLDAPVVIKNKDEFEKGLTGLTGAKIAQSDTLGEIHMALLTKSPERKMNMALMAVAASWTNRGAKGWGGDRVYLLERGDDRGIVWFTWWDTEKDAEEFADAYARHHAERTGFAHARAGRLAVFAFGAAKDTGAEALLRFAAERAKLAKGDRPFGG